MHTTAESRTFFILAGMPRAGTTYWYHTLAAHPSFQVTTRKEIRFFSSHHERGNAWYRNLFRAGQPGAWCTDLSPDYFMHREAAGRIASFPQEVKVALAVRDPAEWSVSLHRHLRSFEPDIAAFSEFIEDCRYPDFRWPRSKPCERGEVLLDGFVSHRLEEYRQALGNRLLLFDFAEFERNQLRVLRALERFLAVRDSLPAAAMPSQKINPRSSSGRSRLTYWLSREAVSTVAGMLSPRLLLPWRRRWESRRQAPARNDDASDLALARRRGAVDCAKVRALFVHSPFVLGDGTPFPGT